MEKKRTFRDFLPNIISFTIGLFIAVVFFLIYFFVGDLVLIRAIDASSISFIIVLGAGCLVCLEYFGAFDFFAYGFKSLGIMMFNHNTPKKDNYMEYRNKKTENRKHSNKVFIGIFVSSIIPLIATIILRICFATMR